MSPLPGGIVVTALRLTRIFLRAAFSLTLLLPFPWSATVLWIVGQLSRSRAGTLADGVVLTAGRMAVLIRSFWQAAAITRVRFTIVLGWCLTIEPSNDRDGQLDVVRLPTTIIDGSRLTGRNV
jgi:hypothetical protein